MSLRATGEGHISSIEFREGLLSPNGGISFTPVSRYVSLPEVLPNPSYRKKRFLIKLHEMGFDNECTTSVMGTLGVDFTRSDLSGSVAQAAPEGGVPRFVFTAALPPQACDFEWYARVDVPLYNGGAFPDSLGVPAGTVVGPASIACFVPPGGADAPQSVVIVPQ
jgi:hypothetical protein